MKVKVVTFDSWNISDSSKDISKMPESNIQEKIKK